MRRWLLKNAPDEIRGLYYKCITLSEHEAMQRAEQPLIVALRAADLAINPPDRDGISLDTWSKRLKAATATIRELTGAKP
jgi:hypothetical protein